MNKTWFLICIVLLSAQSFSQKSSDPSVVQFAFPISFIENVGQWHPSILFGNLLAEQKSYLLKDGIALEVTQNYLNQQQSVERIAVARQGVQQAEENYRITDEKFKKGLSLNSDLLDAEVALLQARINVTQSLVDYELAEARLEKAIGD